MKHKEIIILKRKHDDYYDLLSKYLQSKYPHVEVRNFFALNEVINCIGGSSGKERVLIYTPEAFSTSVSENLWQLEKDRQLKLLPLHSPHEKLLLSAEESSSCADTCYKLNKYYYLSAADNNKHTYLFRFSNDKRFNAALNELWQQERQSFVITVLNYPFSRDNNAAIYELAKNYLNEAMDVIYLPLVETWEEVTSLTVNCTDSARKNLANLLTEQSWEQPKTLDISPFLAKSSNGNFVLSVNCGDNYGNSFDFSKLSAHNWRIFWQIMKTYIHELSRKTVIICHINMQVAACAANALEQAAEIYLPAMLNIKGKYCHMNTASLSAFIKELRLNPEIISYLN